MSNKFIVGVIVGVLAFIATVFVLANVYIPDVPF